MIRGSASPGPVWLIPSMNVHDYFEQVGRYNLLIAKDDLNIGLQFGEWPSSASSTAANSDDPTL